jgi:hypothetical protein
MIDRLILYLFCFLIVNAAGAVGWLGREWAVIEKQKGTLKTLDRKQYPDYD